MGKILCQTQIIFVHAYGCLVPEQGVDVPAPVWFWCPNMTPVFNFVSGPCFLLDFRKSLVNLFANGTEAVIIQWNWSHSFGVENA